MRFIALENSPGIKARWEAHSTLGFCASSPVRNLDTEDGDSSDNMHSALMLAREIQRMV
jgi:hypothetical protein